MSPDNDRPTLVSLFEAALDLKSSADREAFLAENCQGDEALRRQVEDLLRADRDAGDFLNQSIPCPKSDAEPCKPSEGQLELIPSEIFRNQPSSRYELMGEIARGGMGAIIHGRDVELQRDLALKILLEDHKGNHDYARRFVKEAQIHGQLQHPGITPVFELGQLNDQRPYFSMKLVEGETLAEILRTRKCSEDQRGRLLGILEQICQTLAYAHSQGVIHRDLKPTNIMVGNFGEVQVMDWGLAKVLEEDSVIEEMEARAASDSKQNQSSRVSKNLSDSDSATRLGSVMGTFPYMPPEQAQGKVEQLDERVDVFALGSLLAEILTGSPAYAPKDDDDIYCMAAEGQLDDCFQRLDECQADAELVRIAKSCLAPNREARIKNAGLVSSKLSSFQESLEARLQSEKLEKVAAKVAAQEERRRRRIYFGICLMSVCFGVAAMFAAGFIRSLYMDKLELITEKERQTQNAELQRERADHTAHLATVRRLSAESRAVQAKKPETSVLLAIESMRLSQLYFGRETPIAHEALLNSTQTLAGLPLLGDTRVSDMVMSEDQFVALAEGQVHVLDLLAGDNSKQSVQVLGNNSGPIRRILMSEDGRWLLTLGEQVQRWDLEHLNDEPQVVWKNEIKAASISSEGRWIVLQDQTGTIRLLDTAANTRSKPRVLAEDSSNWDRLLVSRNAGAVVLQSESACCLLKVGEHAVERTDIPARSDIVFTSVLSRQSKWLAVGDRDGVRLFDLEATDVLRSKVDLPTTAYPNAIKGLQFSQDSRWLFGWHPNFSWITRWDLANVQEMPLVLKGHDGGVRSLAFTEDGQSLAFGSGAGTLEVVSLSSRQKLEDRIGYQLHDWPVEDVVVHPQGNWMATTDWHQNLRFWNLKRACSSPFILRGQDDEPYSPVATSSAGRWIVSGLRGFDIELWDTRTDRNGSAILTGHTEKFQKFVFGEDDRWLATLSFGKTKRQARIWDLSHPSPSLQPRVLPDVVAIAAAQNYPKIAAVYEDDTVRLINPVDDAPATSAQIVGTHEIGSLNGSPRIVISPDARWLVTKCQTASPEKKALLYVWDLHADDIAATCQMLDAGKQFSWGNGLVIDATSRWLVSSGGEGSDAEDTVTVWDLLAEDVQSSAGTIKESGGVYQVAVSPNCEWIFTAGGKDVQLWDLRNGKGEPHPLPHCGQSAAISLDGRWLAAGGRVQFNTLLFDLEADEPWSSARELRGHKAPIWSLAFSTDSRWLVTDSSDGTVRRWCMDTEWLLQHAKTFAGREMTSEERTAYRLEDSGKKQFTAR